MLDKLPEATPSLAMNKMLGKDGIAIQFIHLIFGMWLDLSFCMFYNALELGPYIPMTS